MDICKHYKNNFTWRRNWIWYHFHMAAMTIPKTQSFYILSLLFVACQRTQNVRFSLGSNLVMTPCTFTYRIVATLTYQCAPGSTTSTILTALFYSNMKIQKCRCFGADSPKISLLWKFSKKKKKLKANFKLRSTFSWNDFFLVRKCEYIPAHEQWVKGTWRPIDRWNMYNIHCFARRLSVRAWQISFCFSCFVFFRFLNIRTWINQN